MEGTRELPDIPGFALELGALERPGQPPAYPASVARLDRAQLNALGERYLAQTRPHRVLGRPRFVDKMPANFNHIGLIHLLLPNAKIIDARRAPLACCFANFKQHFQSGVWFTYSLEDLGRYYRDYVRLMQHFDSVLPGRVHRVQYEALVGDLEGEVRRLLAYCGLPFEEQCLRLLRDRAQRPDGEFRPGAQAHLWRCGRAVAQLRAVARPSQGSPGRTGGAACRHGAVRR